MRETRTTWTCDDCGSAEVGLTHEQPEGWARLIISRPPLAHPFEVGPERDWQICRNCAEIELSRVRWDQEPDDDDTRPTTDPADVPGRSDFEETL